MLIVSEFSVGYFEDDVDWCGNGTGVRRNVVLTAEGGEHGWRNRRNLNGHVGWRRRHHRLHFHVNSLTQIPSNKDFHILSWAWAFLLIFLAYLAAQKEFGEYHHYFLVRKNALILGTQRLWVIIAANLKPNWYTMVPASLYVPWFYTFTASIIWVAQKEFFFFFFPSALLDDVQRDSRGHVAEDDICQPRANVFHRRSVIAPGSYASQSISGALRQLFSRLDNCLD
ncbi:hypothetical protein ACH5RR_005358 [Cinchona calisaya]|uniref:Uncharacterized protein n=1 Tax=Cinchona calisaya TaxID=153742 RepID=A0ABD3AL00_9GENT